MEEKELFRQNCIKHDIPIISKDTEIFLNNYILTHKPKSLIEIGSAVGFSTSVLWESMWSYNPYGEIFSREVSYPHYRQAIINTRNYKNIRLLLWNFCSYNCDLILKRNYFDMVFIDGRKSETLIYLTKIIPYIHNNTHIIIDDVIKFKEKMIDCYDFLDKNNIEYTVKKLDEDDWILIIPKSQSLIKALCAL
jgi:predicted O-methyltransferase YrrM